MAFPIKTNEKAIKFIENIENGTGHRIAYSWKPNDLQCLLLMWLRADWPNISKITGFIMLFDMLQFSLSFCLAGLLVRENIRNNWFYKLFVDNAGAFLVVFLVLLWRVPGAGFRFQTI